ncbi:MAG: PP2C family protein-serine/threonine phosphatase [Acidobacteriota bacterium]
MKVPPPNSVWDVALPVACLLVAFSPTAPEQSVTSLSTLASVLLLLLSFVWYWRRQMITQREKFPKLRAASLAVQVLWLTVLYSQTTSLLPVPEPLAEPLSALLLAAGASALSIAIVAALDFSLLRQGHRAWLPAVGFLLVVASTLLGEAALAPLSVAGLLLGLVAPMGWLITLDRRQRVSVLAGGVLCTIPLVATASIFTLAPMPGQLVLSNFVRLGSLFCLFFVILLLVRAGQGMSGAALYERKVRELDAVYDFGLTMGTALDSQEFQAAVLRYLMRVGSPDVAAVVEPEAGNKGSIFALLRVDVEGEHLYRYRSRASWAAVAKQFADRRPLVVADHRRSQTEALRRIWEPGTGSSVCLPVLSAAGEPRALLIAGRHETNAFSRAEIRSLSGFASQVGLAMEHARLLRDAVESERRKSELEIARQMQVDLLPKQPPQVSGLDIADRSVPATEVGGDYFDYLDLPKSRLGLVFGDVAGHGMSAGLIMAMAKSAIHTQVRAASSPKLLLPRLGELLLEMSAANQYMTMVFAQLDVAGRQLWYVNAGHHYPLHYKAGSGRIERLESTGPPLGLLPSSPGEARERPLEAGDVLAFYSDGLVEAFNDRDEEFGIARLERIVAEGAVKSAEAIVEAAFDAVLRFSGNEVWHDDASLVIVRMLPN